MHRLKLGLRQDKGSKHSKRTSEKSLPDTLRLSHNVHDRIRINCNSGQTSHSKEIVSRRLSISMAVTALTLLRGTSLASEVQDFAINEETRNSVIDTTVTDKVYLDIGVADSAMKPSRERFLGSKTVIPDATFMGRVEIGLYGNHVPVTVTNFLELVKSGALTGTTLSRILPGEYIMLAHQGSTRLGELSPPSSLKPNPEVLASDAFRLPHLRPGTVSLAIAENDEETGTRLADDYIPTEFMITTGPGPVPRLDDGNIVFGTVLSGLETVRGLVATVPTFTPSDNAIALNAFASFIGDERAANVRRKYGRPLKAVVVLDAGVSNSQ